MTMTTKMPKVASKSKSVRDSIIKKHIEIVRDFERRNFGKKMECRKR